MKLLVPVFVLVAGVCSLFAESKSPVLMPGMGQHHHTISTKSPEGQRFFDQGLTLIFAFNHEEAARAFRRASELDPQSAMPFWGIALALGPCINLDVDPSHEKAAYEAVQKAWSLAPGASEVERAYIQALAKRYSSDAKVDLRKLDAEYAHAMRELSKRYPDDLDAATLYAESLMDLSPWKLWSLDGRPAENTEEIVAVLESVLRRDSDHIGANHYYIHAVEASTRPERALASARRLETLAPAAGHLVHMPAHIYFRAGEYRAAARSNALAAEIDRAYLRESRTIGSMYDILYYAHNLQFLAAAYSMEGRFADAKQAADDLAVHIGPMVLGDMSMAEPYVPTPIFVLLRFHRWDEVLKIPPPDSNLVMTAAFWHFAHGSAAAAKRQIGMAEVERGKLEAARKEIPVDTEFSMFSNKAQAFLDLAANILDARIATARADTERAIEYWKNAVQIQDRLYYGEPPEWFYPVRESLGGALLLNGQADQAEAVFRADLEQYPRNPRSLFGLLRSLEAEKKSAGVEEVRREFEAAWKNADMTLELGDL
jgi:tetratricopeptide (TPR) repeat protein